MKKKLKRLQSAAVDLPEPSESAGGQFQSQCLSPPLAGNRASTYASSAENISRLLQGWMRSSPEESRRRIGGENSCTAAQEQPKEELNGGELVSGEEFDSILSFENWKNVRIMRNMLERSKDLKTPALRRKLRRRRHYRFLKSGCLKKAPPGKWRR